MCCNLEIINVIVNLFCRVKLDQYHDECCKCSSHLLIRQKEGKVLRASFVFFKFFLY